MWFNQDAFADAWRERFVRAVGEMADDHDGLGCRWWVVADDDENVYAIVLGWLDEDGHAAWRLHAKVAYQSKRSIMQCDYDIDWLMPYDPMTGDVWDTDVAVTPESAAADWGWLVSQASELALRDFVVVADTAVEAG